MRQLVYAALPLGIGAVVDTFMGSGATLAACEAQGLESVGVERDDDFYKMAVAAVPKLAKVVVETESDPTDEQEELKYPAHEPAALVLHKVPELPLGLPGKSSSAPSCRIRSA